MCNPLLIGMGISLMGTAGDAYGQKRTADKNEKAVEAAMALSKLKTQQEHARQDALASKSRAAMEAGTEQVGGEAQAATQKAEAERLDPILSAGISDQPMQAGVARDTNELKEYTAEKTVADARQTRGAASALAQLMGYGGTQGGLQTVNQKALQEAGMDINLVNSARRGSMGVSQQERSIGPAQYQYASNGLGPAMQAIGGLMSLGAGASGNTWAGMGNLVKGAGTGSTGLASIFSTGMGGGAAPVAQEAATIGAPHLMGGGAWPAPPAGHVPGYWKFP